MKFIKLFLYLVFSCLLAHHSFAGNTQDELVHNVWKMERQTGLGNVKSVWMFFEDGSGVAYQKVSRNRKVSVKHHQFTYSIKGERITVQEEIDKEWQGYFGVSHWKLQDKTLMAEVKFRKEVITFTAIEL